VLALSWWAAQALSGDEPTWRLLPASAVLLVAWFIAMGELSWLLSRAGLPHAALPFAFTGLFTVGCAGAAARRLRSRRDQGTIQGRSTWRQQLGTFVVVAAAMWPALRPGLDIGTAEFVLPAVDIMHNMSRAALVQEIGYIPYGLASPVSELSGDYYPRGFHLMTASLAQVLHINPRDDAELWALDFARLFWLMWGLVMLALAAWAVRLQEMRSASRPAPLVFVAVTTPAVLLLAPVFWGIVLPGFPSFALALLGTIVALTQLSATRALGRALVVSSASAVVVIHAWQPLLLVIALAGAVRIFREWRESPMLRSTSAFAVVGVAVALTFRPLGAALLSGDATSQARENGSIAGIPVLVLAAWAVGVVVWLASPTGGERRAVIGAAFFGAVLLECAALVVTDGEWNLYYPRKVVWASVLIFLPPLAVAARGLLAAGSNRVQGRISGVRIEAILLVLVIVAALMSVRSITVTVLANRPFLEARLAAFAHQSLDRSDVQVVAHRFMTEESDYAADMWGRGGLELQGPPALNLSDVKVGDMSLGQLCATPDLKRRLLVYSTDNPTAEPITCGRVAE